MEVIEDGNIMDRVPILLQRDLEYYQKNQTVLSEMVCCGVVGGRLDFPRNASFASVKVVLWLEEEFYIAFKHGSGMFVSLNEEKMDNGVAKTSDPDKFVQLTIKSADMLLEHLHVLVQEALDHADLPVLTATLGAAALIKNALHCYLQHLEDSGSAERHSLMQACYKRYVTMSEAVAERVLDLHNRVLSLYILQDSGGRPIDDESCKVQEAGSPSVQGWWLYMQGSRKDLWDTVPPRMAQRIFAGMLNETLTILNVRYCQTLTTEKTTPLLVNDILNILLCTAQLLPSVCSNGSELAGFDVKQQAREVRDVHAKCNELFQCLVYRGADLHYIHQAFSDEKNDSEIETQEHASPWFTFTSPSLFDNFDDLTIRSIRDMPPKAAIALDLIVLLAQPQPSWPLLVKVLTVRDCFLSKSLLITAISNMGEDRIKWPASGKWFSQDPGQPAICKGFLCTADQFCLGTCYSDCSGYEHSRVVGALTFILATIGSKTEFKNTLVYALETSGRDWAVCLDKKQVWCDRRPSWLAGLLGTVGTTLRYIPPILVNAVQTGASMYQTISLCISCISRTLDCLPRSLINSAATLERSLPHHVHPVGNSVLLQMLLTVLYEELLIWARNEAAIEKSALSNDLNGDLFTNSKSRNKAKQVRITLANETISPSASFDGSHSQRSSIALAVAEALCSLDEDHKHAQEIDSFIAMSKKEFKLSNLFGLDEFPEFADFFEEGNVSSSNAERAADAAALTTQILMTAAGRDSLRVVWEHLTLHSERVTSSLDRTTPGADGSGEVRSEVSHSATRSGGVSWDTVPLAQAPILYVMFHIGRRPFDLHLRKEWLMPWSRLVAVSKRWTGVAGARVHISRRTDVRSLKQSKCSDKIVNDILRIIKSSHIVKCDSVRSVEIDLKSSVPAFGCVGSRTAPAGRVRIPTHPFLSDAEPAVRWK